MGRKNKRMPERYLPLPKVGGKDPTQRLQDIINETNRKPVKDK